LNALLSPDTNCAGLFLINGIRKPREILKTLAPKKLKISKVEGSLG
jgi:hypothetical protein